MPGHDFRSIWDEWYPAAPPLGHLLREAYPGRWFRVHSLPGAKRYPDKDAEWRELLLRHNSVATRVLGPGAECALIVPHGDNEACLGEGTELESRVLAPIGVFGETGWREDAPVGESGVRMGAAGVKWHPGGFDRLIRAVAEDRMRALFVNLANGRAYAPYDGGADLFLRDPAERDRLRERYRDWLSARSDGL